MEGNGVCETSISVGGTDFFSKVSNLVHTPLTQMQLNDTITIPETLIQDVHNVITADQFCRICGSEGDHSNLLHIFGDRGTQLELHRKIVTHLHLQVGKGDRLPQHVCNTCIYQLNICQQLFEISRVADAKLRQLFLIPQMPEVGNDICLNVPVNVIANLGDLQHHVETSSENVLAGSTTGSENTAFINQTKTLTNSQDDCERNNNLIKDADSAESVKGKKKDENDVSLLCHICGKQFKHSMNLQAHRRTHLDDSLKKKHQCSLCPKSFHSKFHLSEHMNFHNGLSPYSCPECGKSFHKRALLRQHSQIHAHDSKKVVCEVCGLRFSRKSNLLAHARTHSKERTFDCRLCLKQFPTFSAMMSHRRKHTQEDLKQRLSLDLVKNKDQIFTCEVCYKLFTNKESLASHLEHHRPGELSTKYECKDCGKMLRSRHSLLYHQRSQHSGERSHHCSFCAEGFMTKALLQAHEARHTGEKPFKCETCWKGFRSRNNLAQHMLKHTGEKNFQCTVCNKKFFRKSALNVHNRKHTGEKPFICDLCGRPFGQKNDMLKHQKTHLEPNSRSRTCNLCMTVFSSKKELTKHREAAHKEDVGIVPLIITNDLFETHIITEDGQNIVFTAVDQNTFVNPDNNHQ